MPIKYTNLDFGSQGLKNLLTTSFNPSLQTSSNSSSYPGALEFNLASGDAVKYLKYEGYYQIFPSKSSDNIYDSLLPLRRGDIVTFDSGAFGSLSGSISREIVFVSTKLAPDTILFIDEPITSSFNTASWTINRKVDDENYMILELPYEFFGDINFSGSNKQKINGFLVPQNYNPDLLYKLNTLASKLGLE